MAGWRTASVYVAVVSVVTCGAWFNDQANAAKVEEINRTLTNCRTEPTSPHRSFYD